MFEREIKLIGINNLEKINKEKVIVVGAGGVGGYAIEALVRASITNVMIIDYDTIDITNLNRQIIATQNNIGKYKVDVVKERINSINPNCNVITLCKKLDEENLNEIFNFNPTYIIDACDTLKVKQKLIIECKKRNIKLISSMGTGNKLNPELLKITDIRKTSYDPLAKKIRKFVIDNKIKGKVMVVSSTESPKKVEGTISSISFVPPISGLLCASYVINDIIKNK